MFYRPARHGMALVPAVLRCGPGATQGHGVVAEGEYDDDVRCAVRTRPVVGPRQTTGILVRLITSLVCV